MSVEGRYGGQKRRRKIVRRDNGKVVEFEVVKYGMLMMVLCDRIKLCYKNGAYGLAGIGLFFEHVDCDWGYRGCEGVIVCVSWEMRAIRQVVEGVIRQIKLFNACSGWRTLTCVLVYVYAYAIGYS